MDGSLLTICVDATVLMTLHEVREYGESFKVALDAQVDLAQFIKAFETRLPYRVIRPVTTAAESIKVLKGQHHDFRELDRVLEDLTLSHCVATVVAPRCSLPGYRGWRPPGKYSPPGYVEKREDGGDPTRLDAFDLPASDEPFDRYCRDLLRFVLTARPTCFVSTDLFAWRSFDVEGFCSASRLSICRPKQFVKALPKALKAGFGGGARPDAGEREPWAAETLRRIVRRYRIDPADCRAIGHVSHTLNPECLTRVDRAILLRYYHRIPQDPEQFETLTAGDELVVAGKAFSPALRVLEIEHRRKRFDRITREIACKEVDAARRDGAAAVPRILEASRAFQSIGRRWEWVDKDSREVIEALTQALLSALPARESDVVYARVRKVISPVEKLTSRLQELAEEVTHTQLRGTLAAARELDRAVRDWVEAMVSCGLHEDPSHEARIGLSLKIDRGSLSKDSRGAVRGDGVLIVTSHGLAVDFAGIPECGSVLTEQFEKYKDALTARELNDVFEKVSIQLDRALQILVIQHGHAKPSTGMRELITVLRTEAFIPSLELEQICSRLDVVRSLRNHAAHGNPLPKAVARSGCEETFGVLRDLVPYFKPEASNGGEARASVE